jgi:hypothetical protein
MDKHLKQEPALVDAKTGLFCPCCATYWRLRGNANGEWSQPSQQCSLGPALANSGRALRNLYARREAAGLLLRTLRSGTFCSIANCCIPVASRSSKTCQCQNSYNAKEQGERAHSFEV